MCRQPVADNLEKLTVEAAVMISRHDVIPFDLAVVDVCTGQRFFSFLCVEWGIIADVDVDSEQYRFLGNFFDMNDNEMNNRSVFYLGEARFTVEAIKRILRKYREFIIREKHFRPLTE